MAAICRQVQMKCIDPVIHFPQKAFQLTKTLLHRIWSAAVACFFYLDHLLTQALRLCGCLKRPVVVQPKPQPTPTPQLQPPLQVPPHVEPQQQQILLQQQAPQPNPLQAQPRFEPQPQPQPVDPLLDAAARQRRLQLACNAYVIMKVNDYNDLPLYKDRFERSLKNLYMQRSLYRADQLTQQEIEQTERMAKTLGTYPEASIQFLKRVLEIHIEGLPEDKREPFKQSLKDQDEALALVPLLCIRALVFTRDATLGDRIEPENYPLMFNDPRVIKGDMVADGKANSYFARAVKLNEKFLALSNIDKKVVLDRKCVDDGTDPISDDARNLIREINALATSFGQGNFAYEDVCSRYFNSMA